MAIHFLHFAETIKKMCALQLLSARKEKKLVTDYYFDTFFNTFSLLI